MIVAVAVGVAEGGCEPVGVTVGVRVAVPVGVGVGDRDPVGVTLGVGVDVAVGEGEPVALGVTVGEAEGVDVTVRVGLGDAIDVGVGVSHVSACTGFPSFAAVSSKRSPDNGMQVSRCSVGAPGLTQESVTSSVNVPRRLGVVKFTNGPELPVKLHVLMKSGKRLCRRSWVNVRAGGDEVSEPCAVA